MEISRNDRARLIGVAASASTAWLFGGCQADDDSSQGSTESTAHELRNNESTAIGEFIAQQVGGLDKLKVPGDDADIPLPQRIRVVPVATRRPKPDVTSANCCFTTRSELPASTSTRATRS